MSAPTADGSGPDAARVLDSAAQRVDTAVERAGLLAEADRAVAMDLKAAVEAFHRDGLVRVVQRLKADPRGKELLFELVDDPVVYALLVMHGIVRADPATLARQALDGVRPYLRSHGGDVELVAVELPVAQVQLSGACTGCSQSATTLQEVVERALVSGVPGLHQVEVVPAAPAPAFVPLSEVGGRRAGDGGSGAAGWTRGPALDAVADGRVTVWRPDGAAADDPGIALVRIGDRVSAYRDECAHAGLTLENALVDAAGGTVRCAWHGMTYDASTGEALSMVGKRLTPHPARVDGGAVWLRL